MAKPQQSVVAKKQTITIGDGAEATEVTSTPLPPWTCLDLMPEVGGMFTGAGLGGVASKVEIVAKIIAGLGGGKLRGVLPRLLASTTLPHPSEPNRRIALDSIENQNVALDGRFGLLPEIVAFALEVNFRGFFAGVERLLVKLGTAEGQEVAASP